MQSMIINKYVIPRQFYRKYKRVAVRDQFIWTNAPQRSYVFVSVEYEINWIYTNMW